MKISLKDLYIYGESVDFRKSINGLSMLLSSLSEGSIKSGTGCLFYNSGRDKLKLLYFESHGSCLWYKRLEKRRYKIPKDLPLLSSFEESKLLWLRSGLDLEVFSCELYKDLLHFY